MSIDLPNPDFTLSDMLGEAEKRLDARVRTALDIDRHYELRLTDKHRIEATIYDREYNVLGSIIINSGTVDDLIMLSSKPAGEFIESIVEMWKEAVK